MPCLDEVKSTDTHDKVFIDHHIVCVDDPTYISTGDVIEQICHTYGWQPRDFPIP